MIVVDTNIISYLYLPTKFTEKAERLLETEPVWAAPYLWRSEFRNVLAHYMRKNIISFEKALKIQNEAESLMAGYEFEAKSLDVLALIKQSNCSAYDCEFVSLAQSLNTELITMDKKILNNFPQIASPL